MMKRILINQHKQLPLQLINKIDLYFCIWKHFINMLLYLISLYILYQKQPKNTCTRT